MVVLTLAAMVMLVVTANLIVLAALGLRYRRENVAKVVPATSSWDRDLSLN